MKDPKTLEAIDKIRAILREYDLWACLMLISEERAHWLYHVDPSWSCLNIDGTTGKAHIRARVEDFKTPEMHHHVLEQTVGAIMSTRDLAAQTFSHMDKLKALLEEKIKIEHQSFLDVEYHQEKKV